MVMEGRKDAKGSTGRKLPFYWKSGCIKYILSYRLRAGYVPGSGCTYEPGSLHVASLHCYPTRPLTLWYLTAIVSHTGFEVVPSPTLIDTELSRENFIPKSIHSRSLSRIVPRS